MKYYTVVETAVYVRKALAAAFPGVKFSVTSDKYSGGATIAVKWLDGPTVKQVETITDPFEGATFDGMQDLKEYHESIDPDGHPCHWGADWVNCTRSFSVATLARIARKIAPWYGKSESDYTITDDHGYVYLKCDSSIIDDRFSRDLGQVISAAAHEISRYRKPQPRIAPPESKPVTVDSESPAPVTASASPTSRVGEYKGHPTITLIDGDKEFSFGLAKARQILANLAAIQAFVDAQS